MIHIFVFVKLCIIFSSYRRLERFKECYYINMHGQGIQKIGELFNMYSVQLAVKKQLIYCTVCTMYKTTCFGLF